MGVVQANWHGTFGREWTDTKVSCKLAQRELYKYDFDSLKEIWVGEVGALLKW